MVKFEDIYQDWLEKQENRNEIIELVEKFFDGFRGLYGIECNRIGDVTYDFLDLVKNRIADVVYDCLNIGLITCTDQRFGLMSRNGAWFFYVEETIVVFTKDGYERFSFVPRTDQWDAYKITSLPCSLCRYIIFKPTPEQIESKICHRHNLLT